MQYLTILLAPSASIRATVSRKSPTLKMRRRGRRGADLSRRKMLRIQLRSLGLRLDVQQGLLDRVHIFKPCNHVTGAKRAIKLTDHVLRQRHQSQCTARPGGPALAAGGLDSITIRLQPRRLEPAVVDVARTPVQAANNNALVAARSERLTQSTQSQQQARSSATPDSKPMLNGVLCCVRDSRPSPGNRMLGWVAWDLTRPRLVPPPRRV